MCGGWGDDKEEVSFYYLGAGVFFGWDFRYLCFFVESVDLYGSLFSLGFLVGLGMCV